MNLELLGVMKPFLAVETTECCLRRRMLRLQLRRGPALDIVLLEMVVQQDTVPETWWRRLLEIRN